MPVANPRVDDSDATRLSDDTGVLIFARAPRPGHCKRRLSRGCNHLRAARLYRAMLERAAECASRVAPGRVTLICTPDTGHPLFARLARRYALTCRRQTRGDLGARMHAAVRAGLEHHRRVILVGSDQPDLGGNWAVAAERALYTADHAWLAPTRDGGYWAIGLNRAPARVFRLRRWSTSRVARQTHRRLQRCALDTTALGPRNDIDTWRDWCLLRSDIRTAIARAAAMPALAAR